MKRATKKANISFGFRQMKPPEIVTFGNGTIIACSGNIFFPSMPIDSTMLGNLISAVENDLSDIAAGETSTELTKLLALDADALMMALTTNGHYVEDTANTVAAGNLAKAEEMIRSSGYKLKRKGSKPPRKFDIIASGIQWVNLRVKSVCRNAGYIWRYAPVSAKGLIPSEWGDVIFTLETELVINGLKSATIYAFQFASILPVSHSKKAASSTTIVEKTASVLPISKKSKVTHTDGQEQLKFSDSIYFSVQ